MKKVLITGGTGNLGKVMVNLLAKNGYEISVLTSNNELPDSGTIKFIKGDLTKKESLIGLKNKFNTVVHCASNALDSDSVDVKGTQNLLDTLSQDKIRHFIYIPLLESIKVHINTIKTRPMLKNSYKPITWNDYLKNVLINGHGQ